MLACLRLRACLGLPRACLLAYLRLLAFCLLGLAWAVARVKVKEIHVHDAAGHFAQVKTSGTHNDGIRSDQLGILLKLKRAGLTLFVRRSHLLMRYLCYSCACLLARLPLLFACLRDRARSADSSTRGPKMSSATRTSRARTFEALRQRSSLRAI